MTTSEKRRDFLKVMTLVLTTQTFHKAFGKASSKDHLRKGSQQFQPGLDGVVIHYQDERIIGGFYRGEGNTRRPTAILIHGLPGVEKHLDIAYKLRDMGWNCLYFHFRGSWGSSGKYSLLQMEDDTLAALEWVSNQQSVDLNRIILIGTSTGSYPAFRVGAKDKRIAGVLAIGPLMSPTEFKFPRKMAEDFSEMLNGISAAELLSEWNRLEDLKSLAANFSTKPAFIISAGADTIFPPSSYSKLFGGNSKVKYVEKKDADHGFSKERTWLVDNAVKWLSMTFDKL